MEKEKSRRRAGSIPGHRTVTAGKQGMGQRTPDTAQSGLVPFLRTIEDRRAVLVVPLGPGEGEGNGGPA